MDVSHDKRTMRLFKVEGWFEATDIDDALLFLGEHFMARATDTEEEQLWRRCQMSVGPADKS